MKGDRRWSTMILSSPADLVRMDRTFARVWPLSNRRSGQSHGESHDALSGDTQGGQQKQGRRLRPKQG